MKHGSFKFVITFVLAFAFTVSVSAQSKMPAGNTLTFDQPDNSNQSLNVDSRTLLYQDAANAAALHGLSRQIAQDVCQKGPDSWFITVPLSKNKKLAKKFGKFGENSNLVTVVRSFAAGANHKALVQGADIDGVAVPALVSCVNHQAGNVDQHGVEVFTGHIYISENYLSALTLAQLEQVIDQTANALAVYTERTSVILASNK